MSSRTDTCKIISDVLRGVLSHDARTNRNNDIATTGSRKPRVAKRKRHSDYKTLRTVLLYVKAFVDLEDIPLYLRPEKTAQTIIALLDAIESQTFDVADVYYNFGRVLVEARQDITNGTTCFTRAVDIFLLNLQAVAMEHYGIVNAVLIAIQHMVKLVDSIINPENVSWKNIRGSSLLHCIGQYGDEFLHLAEVCIQKGADVNATNNRGETALYVACERSDCEIVKCFVEYGANIEVIAESGMTALHRAIHLCCYKTVKCLVDSRANVEAVDSNESTALHLACSKGNNEIV
jgi:ankyrin repeat protein